jgi:hypothetical protein
MGFYRSSSAVASVFPIAGDWIASSPDLDGAFGLNILAAFVCKSGIGYKHSDRSDGYAKSQIRAHKIPLPSLMIWELCPKHRNLQITRSLRKWRLAWRLSWSRPKDSRRMPAVSTVENDSCASDCWAASAEQLTPKSRDRQNLRSKFYLGLAQFFLRGVVILVFHVELSKTRNEENIMRLLILTAAAALVIAGGAMADESIPVHARHHYSDANASVPEGYAPPEFISPHDHETYIENLRDSGYNPANDFTAAGNLKVNY